MVESDNSHCDQGFFWDRAATTGASRSQTNESNWTESLGQVISLSPRSTDRSLCDGEGTPLGCRGHLGLPAGREEVDEGTHISLGDGLHCYGRSSSAIAHRSPHNGRPRSLPLAVGTARGISAAVEGRSLP